MTPPHPASCQVLGCDYKTRENLPSTKLILTDLGLHVQMVHIISSQRPTPVAPPRTRPAKIHILANTATKESFNDNKKAQGSVLRDNQVEELEKRAASGLALGSSLPLMKAVARENPSLAPG